MKIEEMNARIMWISLCVNGYNEGFCWGMQQTVCCNFLLRSAKAFPIMRLHRHGGCESLHTNSRSVEEKSTIQG
ncbi:hypothetical protein KCP70_13105 [Salmonella enterica subsp. enterica]|nr:hypothetical protein KCP70_13105 [Salmonella enterica subsp. enterica]